MNRYLITMIDGQRTVAYGRDKYWAVRGSGLRPDEILSVVLQMRAVA